jgi:hypothetical protein
MKRGKSERVEDGDFSGFTQKLLDHYYLKTDMMGRIHVYADSQGKKELFEDLKDQDILRTRSDSHHVIALMIETVEYRTWKVIELRGVEAFRREAWLEGKSRGLDMIGYKPTELDLQELEKKSRQNELCRVREREKIL